MERDIDYLASIETLDNGKTFASSQGDISASVGCLRYYAGWCDKIHGQTIPAGNSLFKTSLSYRAQYRLLTNTYLASLQTVDFSQ